MFWIARSLALLALAACAPQAAPSDSLPTPAAAGAPVRGVIRVVGSAPVNVQVVLQPSSGGSIRITGPLRDELRNLAGAEVAVAGEVSPSPDPLADRELRATGYEVVSVDGAAVVVGEIVAVDGTRARLRMGDGVEVVLDVPAGVFSSGQKVWVQGPRSLTVQSYGVIRP